MNGGGLVLFVVLLYAGALREHSSVVNGSLAFRNFAVVVPFRLYPKVLSIIEAKPILVQIQTAQVRWTGEK